MKINKFTTALVAMGVISLAGAAQAANPVVYLTGSTAARAIIYGAATTAGQIFDAGHAGTVVSGNNSSSANQIVFEGPVNGTTVDIDCSFTGSEAGIAAVAGQPLTQNVNNGTFALPGVPPTFLTQASGWVTLSGLPIAGGVSTPDLTMADTSQAVSLTPKATFPLKDYGIVGIVPFTFMKGYEATPDTAWNNVVNVTTAEINGVLSAPVTANFVTGNPSDVNDFVAIVGRNKGSGTRVNTFLNVQYPITQAVDQYAYDVSYPTATPGTLTFNGSYAAGQTLTEVFNDGFDGGSGVQQVLNVDGTGSSVVLIGYVGISDGKNAFTHSSGGGSAAYLPYNGVYESDSGVINGSYPFWGQEHLLGSVNQQPSSQAGQVGTAVAKGIAAQLVSANDGKATGAVGPVNTAQSILIPVSLMQVERSSDSGFPVQGTF